MTVSNFFIDGTKIAANEDGQSYFEKISIELNDKGEIGFLSDPETVKSIIFRITPKDYDYDWHNAPQNNIYLF